MHLQLIVMGLKVDTDAMKTLDLILVQGRKDRSGELAFPSFAEINWKNNSNRKFHVTERPQCVVEGSMKKSTFHIE